MAQNASDSQKIDFLWKKIVYGAAKTDISGNIDATNEPNPSPLLIRGDKIIQQASLIANVIPASNSSVVTVYPTTLPIECISTAAIPTPTLTWQTGQTFWIPPEFGSTYQIKVYISPSGQAGNVLTKGTQVFATGTTNNDLWVFDYQAGILNFNSNNTPYASGAPISFTGNSVYISGAVYSGAFGLPSATSVGNITFSNTTISTAFTNGNIYFSPSGTGTVQFTGNAAIGLPYGTDATRPLYPIIGYTRFNTNRQSIEYYDGTQWLAPGEAVISSQTINPDGSANAFALSSNTSTAGVLVSINGTLQQPTSAYVIVGNNQIQFTEIPLTTDIVEVRYISVGAVTVGSLQFQNTTFVTLDAANVNVTGNILPSANVTYSLGSSSLQWKDLWVSGNTVYIGGSALTVANGQLSIGGNTVGSAITYSNVNVKAYTETMGFANYSNVNVAAYTQTQSYTNYSNVNVAAYVTTNGLTNYSNVNVAAYTQTQSYTNYSNVNLSAYLGGSVTIGGNLTVNGNVFINGNSTIINANNLSINDSMIYLADDNPADTLDIGFVSAFTNAVRYQHTGFVRDATDGVWKLFANVVAEPTTTVDFTNANYSSLMSGNLMTTNDVRIGGNTLFTNGGYKTLAVGGASGGGFLQFLTNGSAGPYIYNTSQNLVLWTDGGDPKITLNNAANKSVEITAPNVDIVSSNVSVLGNLTVAGNITANVSGFAIGYRDLPQVTAANVTLALADASKHFYANTGAPSIITVPSNANVAFPIGTTIVIVNRGSGNITIQNQGAGAPFLYLAGNATTTSSRTLTQYGMTTLVKTETNLWFVNGTGLV